LVLHREDLEISRGGKESLQGTPRVGGSTCGRRGPGIAWEGRCLKRKSWGDYPSIASKGKASVHPGQLILLTGKGQVSVKKGTL